ncbi:MAG: hypothetical protein LUP99_02535 [Methanomicrobiales archaeon]|nr:hypothetical protein [Methanomicrobiales archaeon]
MVLNALGHFLLIFLDENTPISILMIALVILGLGFALFAYPNTNAIMSSVTPRYYGVTSGTLGTMRLVGQMLSMGVAIMIFALLIGRVEITPSVYPTFPTSVRIGSPFFTILCAIGIYPSMARGRMTKV